MASGSPTVHARLRATRGPLTHSRHFVEELPRTRCDLTRNHLQLQKEISKIEKQAKTAVTNLSNNQQAMRMSLRNIEGRRKVESPLITRKVGSMDIEDRPLLKRQSLFANSTCLTVDSTVEAYLRTGGLPRTRASSFSVDQATDSAVDVTYTSSSTELQPPAAPPPTTTDDKSPYVSTPYNVRKLVRTKLPKSFNSPVANQHHAVAAASKSSNLTLKSVRNLTSKSHDVLNNSRDTHSSADLSSSHDPLRLPPITSSHTVISAHHNTTDKATLKKASQLLGMSAVTNSKKSGSDGPTSFEQFYNASGTNLVIVSPPPTPSGYRDEDHMSSSSDNEDKKDEVVDDSGGDSDSLSVMFDQIKKCRYIRHYYPNGNKPPEAW